MPDAMRVVVMGCGGSGGVPYAGNVWGHCNPENLKNHRTRPSIFIEGNGTKLIVDTGPEFRIQVNKTGVDGTLDAVLYTHAHNDHIMGMDDLRSFSYRAGKKPIPVYGSEKTLEYLTARFDYAFNKLHHEYPPMAEANELLKEFVIGGLKIKSFEQIHGDLITSGFRLGDFAYSTDVNQLPEASLETLKGIKTWIVGTASDDEGSFNHAGLNQIKDWIAYIKPEMTYLTHLNAFCDYDDMCQRLPNYIRPAYDGMEIMCNGWYD